MTQWNHGYNTSMGYTYSFFRELAPSWIDLACLTRQVLPQAEHPFRYLELGCGQGVGLCALAALHPEAEFVGIDFNPLHIDHAARLAAAAGLQNIRFLEGDFLQLAHQWPLELGRFEYVALHGIYSWVSPDLRHALQRGLDHAATPGARVYVSYNTQPGWMTAMPMQHLLRRFDQAHALPPTQAITAGAQFIAKLLEASPSMARALPQLPAKLKGMEGKDPAYLVQEYLHDNWHPLWASTVQGEMASAKLQFLGSATIVENYTQQFLTPKAKAVLAEVQSAPAMVEDLVDTFINQSFRRDLYTRGAHTGWTGEVTAAQAGLTFRAMPHWAGDVNELKFKTSFGEVSCKASFYGPLIELLKAKPMSYAELNATDALPKEDRNDLWMALLMLMHQGIITLYRDSGNVEVARRFNAAIAKAVSEGSPYKVLACAKAANGINVGQIDLIGVHAYLEGLTDIDKHARFVLDCLTRLGQRLAKQGVPIEDDKEALEMMRGLSAKLLETLLPAWQEMGAF